MRVIKFLILGGAVAAGLGAVAIVQSEIKRAESSGAPSVVERKTDEKPKKAGVLVATAALKRGHILRSSDLEWREWPIDAVSEAYVTRSARPEAMQEFSGAVVESGFSKGEPVIRAKVIDLNHPGAVAAMLRPGLRGFAIKIKPEKGAGGFIVPGNYVDIILTRRVQVEALDLKGSVRTKTRLFTDTLVRTVRVLAVDKTLDADGEAALDMKHTVTLEITPEQAELLSLAEEAGRLTLAVRSIADLLDENGEVFEDPLPELVVSMSAFRRDSFADNPETGDYGAMRARDQAKPAPKPAPSPAPQREAATPARRKSVTILRFTSISQTQPPTASEADSR